MQLLIKLFFGLFFLLSIKSYCQQQKDEKKYPELICNCISHDLKSEEKTIIGPETKQAPYNKILHYGVKYNPIDKIRHSTVSFISPTFLLVSHHAVFYKDSINFIELALPSSQKDKWVRFAKNDFVIYYYKEDFNSQTDIAAIKLINPDKVKLLYRGHFEIGDTSLLNSADVQKIHFTGFPCSKFSIFKKNPDTLLERVTDIHEVQINQNNTFIGHKMYSCFGDSGSPLWIEANEKYYLIAVNEGLKAQTTNFSRGDVKMVGVLINADVKKWLTSIIH
jgi:V8-like Glu-specific endopeptidase